MRQWITDGRIEADSRYGRTVLWLWCRGYTRTAALVAKARTLWPL